MRRLTYGCERTEGRYHPFDPSFCPAHIRISFEMWFKDSIRRGEKISGADLEDHSEILFDPVIFRKRHSEFSVLHRISIERR
jgi:hypothetical protein